MTSDIKHINKKMAKGSAWMVLFKVMEKFISIFSTIILARLLAKEDFGLVAMAMVVVALLDLFRTFGFDMALIQNQNATDKHYNTAWTFNIIAAVVISLMLLALTPLAVSFYNDSRLESIIPVLAFGVFVSGFENIGIVAFRKDLTFHKDFAYLISKKFISFIVAIGLALYFGNYWALIGAFVATRISIVILSYYVQSYRPRLCMKKSKELFSFSGWIFVNNIFAFINMKIPEVILGKYLGAATLGVFSVSRDITYSTSGALVLSVNRATFPGYSKLNNNLDALKDSVLNTLGLLGLIIIPASAGFSAIAPVMVPVLLGDQWLESIPVIQVLAYAGLLFAVANLTSTYLALGKPHINSAIVAIRSVISIPIIWYACTEYGLNAVAWSLLLISVILIPISYAPAIKLIHLKISEILAVYIRPVIATTLMILAIEYSFQAYIDNPSKAYNIIDLVLMIIIGAIVYPASLLLLWSVVGKPAGSEQQYIDMFKKKILKKT